MGSSPLGNANDFNVLVLIIFIEVTAYGKNTA